ncbi:YoaK family protein [Streptomyces sp. NPDC020379]|uniref:YoaK family protein n=1 Tax=Streptomyces sp. NPDC020379 TaxID=3365071 RepID=UPI0037A71BBB
MDRPKRRPALADDPMPAAVLGLTMATGMIDAISFLGLGKVFIAMMTGNFIVLGLAFGGAAGFSGPGPALAIAGFALGIVMAGHAERLAAQRARRHWFFHAMAVEVLLLAAALGLSCLAPPTSAATQYTVIVVLSLAMGARSATVRRLGVPDLPVTVGLTGALIALVHDSSLLGGDNEHAARRLGTVVALALGATIGGALMVRLGLRWSLLAVLCTVAAITGAVRVHPAGPRAAR